MMPPNLMEALVPWIDVLDEYTMIDSAYSDSATPIRIRILTDHPAPDPSVFDAMELLTLIGGIDVEAWEQAVYRAWPNAADVLISVAAGRALRFSLIFQLDDETSDSVAWTAALLARAQKHQASVEYFDTREKIERIYAARVDAVPRDELVVCLAVYTFGDTYINRLRLLHAIAADQQARDARPGGWTPVVRVAVVSAGDADDNGVPPLPAMDWLRKILACGVNVASLTLGGHPVDQPESGRALQTLVTDHSASSGIIEEIVIPGIMHRNTTNAVYPLLPHLAGLASVVVDPSQSQQLSVEDRQHLWRWIAHTLLRPGTMASLSKVRINCSGICRADVSSVAELLVHPYPLALLMPGCKKEPCISAPPHQPARKIVFEKITDSTKEAVLQLLHVVGSDVVNLTIQESQCHEPLDAWLHCVFQACPHLESFSLQWGGSVSSLETFAAAYERGICSARELVILGIRLLHWDRVSDFFSRLSDGGHAMAKCLRRVIVSVAGATGSPEKLAEVLRAVRAKNRSLSMLDVRVTYVASTIVEDWSKLQHFEAATTPIVTPLDMRQKLAFLSALLSSRSTRAMQELDASMLAPVLVFASQNGTRGVVVSLTSDGSGDGEEDGDSDDE